MKWTDSIRQTYIFFLNFFVPFFSRYLNPDTDITTGSEDHSRPDRTFSPSQMPVPILPDSELFRKIQHDLVDTVHQRGTRLSAIVLNMFEWQSPCFSVLLRICCFLDWEFAQMYSRYCGEYSSKRLAANFVALVCVAISARKSTLTALQMRLLECSR